MSGGYKRRPLVLCSSDTMPAVKADVSTNDHFTLAGDLWPSRKKAPELFRGLCFIRGKNGYFTISIFFVSFRDWVLSLYRYTPLTQRLPLWSRPSQWISRLPAPTSKDLTRRPWLL